MQVTTIRRAASRSRSGGTSEPDTEPPAAKRMGTLGNLPRLFAQVWRTSPPLTLASIVLRLGRAMQPPLVLYVGKLIVNEIIARSSHGTQPSHGAAPPGLGDWIGDGRLAHLGALIALEFGLVVASDLLARAVSWVDATLGELHANAVSVELMEHAARLDLRHFESSEYQDRLERARRQASGRNALIAQSLGQAQDVITIAALVAGVLAFAPWLVLLLVFAVLPAVLAEGRFNALAYRLSRAKTPERRELDYIRYIGASADSAKEIKLFDLGGFLVERFRRLGQQLYLANRRLALRRAVWGGVFAAISSLTYYAAYVVLVWRTVSGQLTLGDLTFLGGSLLRLHGLLQGLLIGVTQVAGQTLYLDDLFSFFAIRPAIASPPHPEAFPARMQVGIAFEDVGFRYPETDRWAVRGLSFSIRAGETLALVGENGAGKTTIVKLLTRLYDPTEGRITVDGVDLRDIALDDLRDHVGVIFQDFTRYSFTAGENIAVGRAEAASDQDRITAAAERSLADQVIARLRQGYDQKLGRRFAGGQDLSGGEWQKVAIARAYMRDADLLILDEPTAALDAQAEAEVFERFQALRHGRTAVLISHRFSTVRRADRIIVLEDGKVLESGNHASLLGAGGRYAELFRLQAAGYV